MLRKITYKWLLTVMIIVVALPAMAAVSSQDDEVEILWATFWVGTNPLRPWGELLIEEFNEQYAGQYRIVTEEIPGDAQYRDKMRADAVADALPDVITGNVELMRDLEATGRLVELSQFLDADPAWAGQFFDDAFDEYLTEDGELYAISYSVDNVGIYWNEALFAEAGIEEFPTTWEELFDASQALLDAGITPFAMEGNWVTLLMWANMIGTQPGGEEWMNSNDSRSDLLAEPVITATELLREYHQLGYTNEDAFTGNYATAATLFLQADAAMIANGPWMIPQISGVTAETAEGLSDDVSYAISPGNGIIYINGEAAFAVGAKDEAVIEGAVEFIKFLTSPEQMKNQLFLVSRSGPVHYELTDEEVEMVDQRALNINEAAEDVEFRYRHAFLTLLPAQTNEFINFWPSYVQGQLDTEEFLQRIERAAR